MDIDGVHIAYYLNMILVLLDMNNLNPNFLNMTHFLRKRRPRHPASTLPWTSLSKHTINLFQRKPLHLRNKKISNIAPKKQGEPQKKNTLGPTLTAPFSSPVI
jgi:hypothetical protein